VANRIQLAQDRFLGFHKESRLVFDNLSDYRLFK
jgi:hypothetical protein